MTLFNQLFVATYNGIQFLVDTSDMTCGRKTKTFEYPNKKYRYIEDLGENLKTFTLKAVISGDNDYYIKRETLILALQNKGIGILTHPLYGLMFVVVKSYTVTETITTLGECTISITFEEARQNIFPVSGDESLANITNIINELSPYLEAYFITNFKTDFNRNSLDAADKSTKLNTSLQPTIPIKIDDDVLNIFVSKSNDFETNKYALVKNSSLFASTISDLLFAYNDLGKDVVDCYKLNSTAYFFGNDDIEIKSNTAERRERILNRKVYNSYVNSILLMNLYQNALQIEYFDDQQVILKENDLEDKYQYLITNSILDFDILRQIETIRISVKKFFNKIKVNVSKVISVTVPRTTLSVLLYKYYDNFDNEDEIISLNNLKNVTNISGDIKILTVS